ncbi:MAG TPA: 3'(2'),5'-bisphosphate nucleotidase CysQ [Mesorhizobium sp.]|nr:3'(2'),5'-bisphosphate nucleotidase CysQ [Mesorhizobium sp.]
MRTPTDAAAILALFEALALAAGRAVMEVFDRATMTAEEKADHSPVTEADLASERIILEGLRAGLPDLPVVSEEKASAGLAPHDPGEAFILVDPLDGTREFVARNGDFTVNIALVREGRAELGVVYAPCSRRFFSGRPGLAETLVVSGDGSEILERRPVTVRPCAAPPRVVASRSHRTPETDAFIRRLASAELVSVGSSLKFCMIAEGEADIYPRFGRTMEWDTAAGDAVLRAAGGVTLGLDGKPLRYGKRPPLTGTDYENPSFVAAGAEDAVRGLLPG